MGGCTRFDVEPISCNLLGVINKKYITLYMLNFKSCAPSLYTYMEDFHLIKTHLDAIRNVKHHFVYCECVLFR